MLFKYKGKRAYGGGISGCYATIAAARQGKSVVLVEKGAIRLQHPLMNQTRFVDTVKEE